MTPESTSPEVIRDEPEAPQLRRRMGDADYDHPRISLGAAILRSWWLVLLPTIVLAAAGVALGLQRSPTYSATAQLNVGSLDAQAQAVPGFVQASQTLASTYSRIAGTARIVDPVAKSLGISAAELRSDVTVTPVISNPIMRITATSDSAARARELANAMMKGIVSGVTAIDAGGSRGDELLKEYRAASAERIRAEARLRRLRADDAASSTIRQAQTELAADELAADTAGQRYTDAQTSSTAASGVSVLQQAQDGGSDRNSKLQQLGFVGLVAGLVVGAALALLRESRRARRRLA